MANGELKGALDRAYSEIRKDVEGANQHAVEAMELIDGLQDEAERIPPGLTKALGELRGQFQTAAKSAVNILTAHAAIFDAAIKASAMKSVGPDVEGLARSADGGPMPYADESLPDRMRAAEGTELEGVR